MSYPAADPPPTLPITEGRPISPWSTVALYFLNLFFSAITAPVAGFGTGFIYSHFFASEENSLAALFGVGFVFFMLMGFLLAGVISLSLCTLVWLPLWITNHRHNIFERPFIAAIWGALLGLLVLAFILLPWVWKFSQAPAPSATSITGQAKEVIGTIIACLAASAAIPGALVFFISSLCHPRRARP